MIDLRQIGHYRIEARLGSGRYAEVYRAVDTVRKRTVALKALKRELFISEQALSRFLDLIQTASDLVHPHLAWVWEVGEADGCAYVAERYANGPSLAQILAESGPLPWEMSRQMIQHIAQGLDFAHDRGWVHGHVKPGNILLSPDLGAVLTDFGLMKAVRSGGSFFSDPAPGGTPLAGTPPYLAPEIWQGRPASPAADQYALACVWAEALTGKTLFEAPTQAEIQKKHLAPLEPFPALIPWQAATAIKKGLAQDPTRRYPSASEMAAAPDKLAAEAGETEADRARYEAEAQAWRAVQEQDRAQAEDTARLAALEQARREIDEQVRRETEARTQQAALDSAALPVEEEPREFQVVRRPARRSPAWRRWPAWMAAVILVIALAGLWLDNRLSPSSLFPATSTSTNLPPTATASATQTATSTATATTTSSPTASATATLTPTYTRTLTPTQTSTPTITPTITRTSTPTRTPHEVKGQDYIYTPQPGKP